MKVVCDIRVFDDDNNLRFEKNGFRVKPTVYKVSEMATEYGVNFKVVLVDDIYLHKQIKSPFEKCRKCRFCLCDVEGRSCQLGANKYSEACKLFEEA